MKKGFTGSAFRAVSTVAVSAAVVFLSTLVPMAAGPVPKGPAPVGPSFTGPKPAAPRNKVDLSAGASTVVDAGFISEEEVSDGLEELEAQRIAEEEAKKKELVMANVSKSVNVRAEAGEDAEIVGKLYKGCGGTYVDSIEGWTCLRSGDLEGWVSNDYLYLGEEAEAYAKKVGHTVAIVETECLRVRKEPAEDAGVLGLLEINSEHDVVEEPEEGSDWVKIKYTNKTGYVSSDFVTVEFYVDEGETMEEIKEREALAALAKAQLVTTYSAVSCTEDEVALLAALIQCEAGNQSYEGKLAVGAVVCNRVRSGKFPSTITDVIYASGQFGPVSNGSLDSVLASGAKESCYQAAREAIAGSTNVGSARYFKRAGNKSGVVIGAHVFY